MDRLTSFALLADSTRRRVTRLQIRELQRVFPFLELPAEIRNIIYQLCINFGGIKAFFNEFCDLLLKEKADHRKTRVPNKKAPTIFLLNKQIYKEAVYLLRKEKVVLDHGLLKIPKLRKVISSNVLRQVSSIEISDAGHDMLKGKILPESWHGYMRLLEQLADVLADGHHLKELIVRFDDHRLKEHMSTCFDAVYECGFRDSLRDAINTLRKVRGVGKVTFHGINEKLAEEVKAHIESTPKTFLDMPLEVREMVYEQALDWSDISRSLVRGIANWADAREPFPYPRRSTPTILLLNKQITQEALNILHKKPLAITFPAHVHIDEEKQVPHILRFITRDTLKQVRVLYITMESWQWVYNFSRSLVAALTASLNLEVFHLIIKDDLKTHFLQLSDQIYPDEFLHATLKKLAAIRGLKEVCFEGSDLPSCYTEPLMRIMTSPVKAMEVLPMMQAITRSGDVVDIAEGEEEIQPDAEMVA